MLLGGICAAVLVIISRVFINIRILLPIVLIVSWCSTFARHMSQSSAVRTGLRIAGPVICSVTMSTWLLVCVISVLLLVWRIAIVVITVILLIATVVVSIVLVIIVSIVVV